MQRIRRTAMVFGATFLSLSSAPLLCIFVQIGLIVWERVTRTLVKRVSIAVITMIIGYFAVDLVTDRPAFEVLVTNITLDPWTAFYRVQIWRYGLDTVVNYPLTGIGLADWDRAWWMHSSSIDAYWLVIMIRMGIPALLLLVLAIALLLIRANDNPVVRTNRGARRIAFGWTTSLLALGLLGLTVHYWNGVHAYLFMFLGLSSWLVDPLRSGLAVTAANARHLRHKARTGSNRRRTA